MQFISHPTARNIITGLLNTVISVFTYRYTVAYHIVLTALRIFFFLQSIKDIPNKEKHNDYFILQDTVV